MIRVHETTYGETPESASFTLDSWDQFDRYVKTIAAVPYWETNKRFLYNAHDNLNPTFVKYRDIHDGNGLVVSLNAELAKHHPISECAFCRIHSTS
jgi:hypothetical protein